MNDERLAALVHAVGGSMGAPPGSIFHIFKRERDAGRIPDFKYGPFYGWLQHAIERLYQGETLEALAEEYPPVLRNAGLIGPNLPDSAIREWMQEYYEYVSSTQTAE